MTKVFTLEKLGLKVNIGKFARQANGSVWIEHGDNVVLATAVASQEDKDFMGFFPMMVEYREKTSSAGRIPGGYIKREGRLTDVEVLTSRLIDRAIRPLFPKYYFKDVQIISTVLSYDGKYSTGVMAAIGASLALTISDLPFLGPIGTVQAVRIDGDWKFNVSKDELEKSDAEIIISGTSDGINMVEGRGNSIPESELVKVLFMAHEQIKEQIVWQKDIQKELGISKSEVSKLSFWEEWEEKVESYFGIEACESMFCSSKEKISIAIKTSKDSLFEKFEPEMEDGIVTKSQLAFLFDNFLKKHLPDAILKKGKRIDGRSFDQVRELHTEVGLLSAVHGSAMFRRGETQTLASLTLGTAQDAQKVEGLEGGTERTFMLHYNFPPFATGEVKPIRGVGRREIGHGFLAEKSFENVLPSQEEFPYTVRSVVDVLECNGSSSMATVCATTMALMDAGVPITDMVAGIAMGMIQDDSGKTQVLSDILGSEDALGSMDFKITGTSDGIMAVQMDIKAKNGLTKEFLSGALEQAKDARLHILDFMKSVMDGPRKEISELAPRVSSFKIDPEKIGAIIGPGGKTIKEIIAKTDTQIDVDDTGLIRIYSKESKSAKRAEAWVKTLAGEIDPGTVFEGKIKKIAEFGLFVELVPGKDGLVHISSIARDRQRSLEREFKTGDILKVKVVSVDSESGRVRLIAPELAK